MASFFEGKDFGFLFRQDQGTISRRIWLRGTALLVGFMIITTLVFIPISGGAVHLLSSPGLLGPRIAINVTLVLLYIVYLSVYGIAFILAAVSHYNLSAKRARAIGKSPSEAAIFPLAVLMAGAVNLLQPQMGSSMPVWTKYLADLALVLVLAYVLYEFGMKVRDKDEL
ncbi:MAG: hypothetical protein KGQ46_13205 [Hyphomicrobiales bacterium]|nr:hypothetical protein [Hyphomicrobiales bacterium]MDE2113887.1 hypothetical protein [Hyphomicrobiales bacterium]